MRQWPIFLEFSVEDNSVIFGGFINENGEHRPTATEETIHRNNFDNFIKNYLTHWMAMSYRHFSSSLWSVQGFKKCLREKKICFSGGGNVNCTK